MRILIVLLLLFPTVLKAQERFSILEYNCENLFDTLHDAGKNDWEFTPSGSRHWNTYRYWSKLNHITKAIVAAGTEQPIDVVALCEVENDSVLRDLTCRSALRTLDYRFVITHSPDARGIDIALLYQPGRFKLLNYSSVSISNSNQKSIATRDILIADGMLQSGDTLTIIACHLPSKSNASNKTTKIRMQATQKLIEIGDSIERKRGNAKFLVLGDFNAYPDDPIFKKIATLTNEKWHRATPRCMFSKSSLQVTGSYRYKGYWNYLDHIFLSDNLYHSALYPSENCYVVNADFLLTTDLTYGGLKPFRSFTGYKYSNGYSDHLPLRIDLMLSF